MGSFYSFELDAFYWLTVKCLILDTRGILKPWRSILLNNKSAGNMFYITVLKNVSLVIYSYIIFFCTDLFKNNIISVQIYIDMPHGQKYVLTSCLTNHISNTSFGLNNKPHRHYYFFTELCKHYIQWCLLYKNDVCYRWV